MRIVCYAIDIGIVTPNGPGLDQCIFFGEESEVLKTLDEADKTQRQVLIAHPNDPQITPLARVKLQIIGQLKTHDVTKIPKYPVFGTGEIKLRDPQFPVGFQIMLRVSYIGDDAKEDITKPAHILLPAGVRL